MISQNIGTIIAPEAFNATTVDTGAKILGTIFSFVRTATLMALTGTAFPAFATPANLAYSPAENAGLLTHSAIYRVDNRYGVDSLLLARLDVGGSATTHADEGMATMKDRGTGTTSVPAPIWLFGFGMIGLSAVARRRAE